METPSIPADLITAAKVVLQTRTLLEVVRAAIEPIQAEAMNAWKPTITAEFTSRSERVGEPITMWDHLYRADEAITAKIDADVRRMTAERFPQLVPEDLSTCPLLVAKDDLRKAKRALVEAATQWAPLKTYNLSYQELVRAGAEKLNQFIDLTLHMVVTTTPSIRRGAAA